jgi:hypothetical protein
MTDKREPIEIRPPLDLEHMIRQVRGTQTLLALERTKKKEKKDGEEDKGATEGRDRGHDLRGRGDGQ